MTELQRGPVRDWRKIGPVHVCLFSGAEFGLRRYDQVLLAIQTSGTIDEPLKVIVDQLVDMLFSHQEENPDHQIATILCVDDPTTWAEWTAGLATYALIEFTPLHIDSNGLSLQQLRKSFLERMGLRRTHPFAWQNACRDSMFFGRKDVIDEIITSPKTSFAIVGPRRIGKTSLIRRLRTEISKFPGQAYLYLDCYGILDFDDLAFALLRSISPRGYFGRRAGAHDVESELVSAATRQKSRYIVVLDEFDRLATDERFLRIKAWFSGRFRGRIRFIVAGYHTLWDQLQNKDSHLYNVFNQITLGPFTQQEGAEFIRSTLSELSVPVADSSAAISLLLKATGAQPWILQAACAMIIDEFVSTPDTDPIQLVHRVLISKDLRHEVFQATAANCTALGKAVLSLIASAPGQCEASIIEAFSKHNFSLSIDAIGNELRRLRIAGAVKFQGQNLALSSELLSLHIGDFGSFERSLDAFCTEPLPSGVRKFDKAAAAALSPKRNRTPPALFYSYSHKDEGLRNQLNSHLVLLERQKVIATWHDRRITAGAEWEGEIDEHLKSSQIILLLISADFLASNYCYDIETNRALEMHTAKEATVIPIVLRACDWYSAPFGRLQALPTDGKPITSWSNVDEAFTNVAKGIRIAAEEYMPRTSK